MTDAESYRAALEASQPLESDLIVRRLHRMVDDLGDILRDPLFKGVWPSIRVTYANGLTLAVTLESPDAEDEIAVG